MQTSSRRAPLNQESVVVIWITLILILLSLSGCALGKAAYDVLPPGEYCIESEIDGKKVRVCHIKVDSRGAEIVDEDEFDRLTIRKKKPDEDDEDDEDD